MAPDRPICRSSSDEIRVGHQPEDRKGTGPSAAAIDSRVRRRGHRVTMGANMSDDATGFVGSIPENYDRGLGPIIFSDYDEYTARLVAGYAPSRVLETGAGTGIVTRRLRDLLPATTRLIATDLNP